MPAIVLDCSVALSWFMPDEAKSETSTLASLVTDQGAIVPTLWPVEIGNVLVLAVRTRRLTQHQRSAVVAALSELPIEIDSETAIRAWSETLALADRLRLTLYDACYLELAQRRKLPLGTLDRELRTAARKIGVNVMA